MAEIKYQIIANGCWLCTSHRPDKYGYPRMYKNRVFRHMYELNYGKIKKWTLIKHSCDNRLCINPLHLNKGTIQENIKERDVRGRTAKGENNGRSKLNAIEVAEIRANNTTPNMQLSRIYGVNAKIIRDIKQGKTWI